MKNILSSIVSDTDANQCRWTLSCSKPNIRLEHEGEDLDELKRQFNRLLRNMMEYLDPRVS